MSQLQVWEQESLETSCQNVQTENKCKKTFDDIYRR